MVRSLTCACFLSAFIAGAAIANSLSAGPAYLNETHADGASCVFWLKEDDNQASPRKVIETDFQTYWINIGGKDQGFADTSPSPIMNILETPVGNYRLLEGNPLDRECEECTIRDYKLFINYTSGNQSSTDLIGLCGS